MPRATAHPPNEQWSLLELQSLWAWEREGMVWVEVVPRVPEAVDTKLLGKGHE